MKILVDAMGGDNAPGEIIKGVLQSGTKAKIILVGRESEIKKHLTLEKNIDIINATEVIGMTEGALAVRAKKDSSMAIALDMLKAGEADALISAGSTAALVAGATLKLKRLPNVKRPALAVPMPTEKGIVLLMDAGANVDCKPEYLLQFAQIASVFMKELGLSANPKIGLLSNGSEEDKGNSLTKEAFALLKESNLNFYGNIEAKEVAIGTVDVVIADGMMGNVLLKTAEGYLKLMGSVLKKELKSNPITTLGALLSKPALNKTKSFFDPSKVGAGQFLGADRLVLKAHGSSKSIDIIGAIKAAEKFIELDVIEKLKNSL